MASASSSSASLSVSLVAMSTTPPRAITNPQVQRAMVNSLPSFLRAWQNSIGIYSFSPRARSIKRLNSSAEARMTRGTR